MFRYFCVVEIKIKKTIPETQSRKDFAKKLKKSVDFIDNAVKSNLLDYAVIGKSKPVVINKKYWTVFNLHFKLEFPKFKNTAFVNFDKKIKK